MEAVEELRLEIGDEEGGLFSIEAVEHLLNRRAGNVLQAAADACDILATRFAGQFDFGSAPRTTFSRSQKAIAYERRAKALRERVGGLTTVSTTRVDGYSDSVTTREGAGQGSRTGRVKEGYYDPDIPS